MTDAQTLPSHVEPGTRGFVFAATGRPYVELARRAARTLRAVMPEALIDIFTDQDLDDAVFDRVHVLGDDWPRPKVVALQRSRFERSVILDADIIVLADISEVFEVLDRSDIAGVLGISRSPRQTPLDPEVPSCLNPVNTGVLVVRASQKMHAFAQGWETEMKSNAELVDQPTFRRLMYLSDLDFIALAPAYNLINLDMLDVWNTSMGAPRILHVRALHDDSPGDPEQPFDLEEVIGKRRARHVKNLLSNDWLLGGDGNSIVKPPIDILRRRLKKALDQGGAAPGRPPGARTAVARAGAAPDRKREPKKKKPKDLEYHTAILALASMGRPLRICVVGANDGRLGDPLFPLVQNHLRSNSQILLFEPQEYLLPFLRRNYSFHPAHRIINAAIGPDDALTLHAVRPEHWIRLNPPYAVNWPSYRAPTGITSSDRKSVVDWVRQHLPEEPDPDSLVTELNVRAGRLVEFLRERDLPDEIDVLQVDAEGFDDAVIYACDLEVTRPKILRFEATHLSTEKLAALKDHLSGRYLLFELNTDILALRQGG